MRQTLIILLSLLLVVTIFGCGKKQELEPEMKPVIIDDGGGDGSTTGTTGDNPINDGVVVEIETPDFQTVYFDFDKYNLRSDAKAALRHNADEMKSFGSAIVTIEGHCDERGTVEYNLALGEKRARAARDYLLSLGIDSGRLSVISYGKERPVAFGHDEISWGQNRRAEFISQ